MSMSITNETDELLKESKNFKSEKMEVQMSENEETNIHLECLKEFKKEISTSFQHDDPSDSQEMYMIGKEIRIYLETYSELKERVEIEGLLLNKQDAELKVDYSKYPNTKKNKIHDFSRESVYFKDQNQLIIERKKFLCDINLLSKSFRKKPFLKTERLAVLAEKRLREKIHFAISSDQKYLAIVAKNVGEIQIFDINERKGMKNPKITRNIRISDIPVIINIMRISFSPCSKYILAGGAEGYIFVIEIFGEPNESTPFHKLESVKGITIVRFSLDGKRVFVGSEDGQLKSLRYNEKEFSDEKIIIEHLDGVFAFDYCPIKLKYASGGQDKILNIFSLNDDNEIMLGTLIIIKNKHKKKIISISFSYDGEFLLTASEDKVNLFQTDTGNHIITYELENTIKASLCPRNKFILTWDEHRNAKLLDRDSGEKLAEYGDWNTVFVAFFKNRVLAVNRTGEIDFFIYREGHFKRHHPRNTDEMMTVDFSPDGKTLGTGMANGEIKIFEIQTGIEHWSNSFSEGAVYIVRFSPQGNLLFSGGEDSILRIFGVHTGMMLRCINDHRNAINSIVFSVEKMEFATGGYDKNIFVYDYHTYERKFSFSPDRRDSDGTEIASLAFGKEFIVSSGSNDVGTQVICVHKLEEKHSKVKKSKAIPIKEFLPKSEANQLGQIFIVEEKYLIYNSDKEIFFSEYNKINQSITNLFILDRNLFKNEGISALDVFYEKEKECLQIFAITIDYSNDTYSLINLVIEKASFYNKSPEILVKRSLESQSDFSAFPFFSLKKFKDSLRIAVPTTTGLVKMYDIPEGSETILENPSIFYYLKDIQAFDIHPKGTSGYIIWVDGTLGVLNTLSGRIDMKFKISDEKVRCLKYCDTNKFALVVCVINGTGLAFYNSQTQEKLPVDSRLANSNDNTNCDIILLECVVVDEFLNVFCIKNFLGVDTVYHALSYRYVYKIEDNQLVLKHASIFHDKKIILFVQKSVSLFYLLTDKGSLLSLNKHLDDVMIDNSKDYIVIFSELKDTVICASSSFDRSQIITGDKDGFVRIFEIDTYKERVIKGHKSSVCAVGFLSEKRYSISACENKIIKIFDFDSGIQIHEFKNDSKIEKIFCNPIVDSILLWTSNGLIFIDKVLHTNETIINFNKLIDKLEKGKNLQDQLSLNFEDLSSNLTNSCFDLLPLFPNLTFLGVILNFADDNKKSQILKLVVDFLYDNRVSREKKAYLTQSIFRKDRIFSLSAWDIWILTFQKESEDKRFYLENLISIVTYPNIEELASIENKYFFLGQVAKRFPIHMNSVLDAFWRPPYLLSIKYHRMYKTHYLKFSLNKIKRTIWTNAKDKRIEMIYFPLVLNCHSYSTSSRVIEQLYEEFCSRLINDTQSSDSYIDCEVRVSEISIQEMISNGKDLSLSIFRDYNPEDNIFKSELFAATINYLWSLDSIIGIKFYRRLILFLILQILISFNSLLFMPKRETYLNEDPESEWKYLTLFFDGFLLITFFFRFFYKIYDLTVTKNRALKDKSRLLHLWWWIIDYVICIVAVIAYSFDLYYAIVGYKGEDNFWLITFIKCMSASIFALSWFRLLEFAIGFKKTSNLVMILKRVTKDMIAYLLILMFMSVGCAFTIFIVQKSYEELGPWKYFRTIYYILLGDLGDYKTYADPIDWDLYFLLLFFTSVYLVIIMLNLLIAIVSNSFNNIIRNQNPYEIYEKLRYIHDKFYNLSKREREKLKEELRGSYFIQLKPSSNETNKRSSKLLKKAKLENFGIKLDKMETNIEKIENILVEYRKDIEKKTQDNSNPQYQSKTQISKNSENLERQKTQRNFKKSNTILNKAQDHVEENIGNDDYRSILKYQETMNEKLQKKLEDFKSATIQEMRNLLDRALSENSRPGNNYMPREEN